MSKPRRKRSSRSAPSAGGGASSEPLNVGGAFTVVGIGASAGGLDACTRLVAALPDKNGMAFVLVQHLDPSHESMMVDLLAKHTSMTVLQAIDGMPVEQDHLYVIPPGTYLSVGEGSLHLSEPSAPHGARLPFDFFLHSLAEAYATRAVGVVLSGTGADGSLGMTAVKARGGLVMAQDPDEAEYDGMPRSAIATGTVDQILPVAKIAVALAAADRRPSATRAKHTSSHKAHDALRAIIDLLRNNTPHDFTLYKMGTLHRRIERRMALASVQAGRMDRYLDLLKGDPAELDALAGDLLINVTAFFRDPKVFHLLEKTVLPQIVRDHPTDRPLRIWIAGCSTGEEAYSIAMLFSEAVAATNSTIPLQVFASDVDPEAVATARQGLYPDTISSDVSAARLKQFFSKQENGYRIRPELRSSIVFTVQDVLTDPPFSGLDLISCRNLLIYFGPDAQAKAVSLFHFALQPGGILLLGGSDNIGSPEGRFEVIAKPERIYRHIGRTRPGELTLSKGDGGRTPPRSDRRQPIRESALADLCRRLVIDNYAPAIVLTDQKLKCLYSLGPIERYLRVAPGYPTHDLLAMATPALRTRLRAAIERIGPADRHLVVPGGRLDKDGHRLPFNVEIRSVARGGETMLLIGFIDVPRSQPFGRGGNKVRAAPPIAELEAELEATRAELMAATLELEKSGEEQRAINEEALSVNEEYQSTNEELITSKEELQSLNEELTALNSQLQETLERQRVTSNDLQNILYSTDLATLFLDTDLNIRFFTPATKRLFNLVPGDVGRPLADLNSLAADVVLLDDALTVLRNHIPIECEIQAPDDIWFCRRILPYRTHDDEVGGVVVTFTDITERKVTRKALETAKRQAEQANGAKSRFLAVASHDLRQPLQALALLQGLLTKSVEGARAQELVMRLGQSLGAMTGMLDSMLDINQIEAGLVRVDLSSFSINDLLGSMRDQFVQQSAAQNLRFDVIDCGLEVYSDVRILEQIIRNLVSNALKYTKRGRILLGCRRRAGTLRIEVWDTGIGISAADQNAIFDEYHQVDNAARERSRGLGLGLSIVQRLSELLDHRIGIRSDPGKGSVFSIEVPLAQRVPPPAHTQRSEPDVIPSAVNTGTILVVEDDRELRDLLEMALKGDGHRTLAASDSRDAIDLIAQRATRPDLILTDYNLPNAMTGLQIGLHLREILHHPIPVIILTGDISTTTLREIAGEKCVQLNKPVKPAELLDTIQRLLRAAAPDGQPHVSQRVELASATTAPTVFLVDDDSSVRRSLRELLEDAGLTVKDYADCDAFLAAFQPIGEACLLLDAYLPGMNGIELLQKLRTAGHDLPAIMITGSSDVPIAVEAMKAGACDFIEKPVGCDELLASVHHALELSRDASKLAAWRESAVNHMSGLTQRQRQVLGLVLAGHPSKNIASDLGISQRTVENHRATIMQKTGAKSLPALARLAVAADWREAGA